MGKFKKILSVVTALTLSASAFAGLTVTTASATGELPATIAYNGVNLTVTSQVSQQGAKLVVARYNAGALTNVTVDDIDLSSETPTTLAKPLFGGDKVMIWKALAGEGAMEPLANPYPVTGAEAPPAISANLVQKALYDFEDSNTVFTADSRVTVEQVTPEKVAIEDDNKSVWKGFTLTDNNAVGFVCAGNAQNGYSFAHYDFSSLVTGSVKTQVEFDYYNTNGSRSLITLGDASVRGTDGGSTKTTYSSTGAIFYAGSGNKVSMVNGTTSGETELTNKWMHVIVTVDEIAKTYDYTITEKSSGDTLKSGTGVAFAAEDASNLTQIDMFGYINNSKSMMIDNLKISAATVTSNTVTYNYYTKTGDYTFESKTTTESVTLNQKPARVPENTYRAGYIFKGWTTDGDGEYKKAKESRYYTTEQLKNIRITAETTFTAVYLQDTAYIEPIVTATITGPDTMTFGPDPNTAADNEFTLTLKGEKGTVITASTKDGRVNNFDIKWDIEGFKTENDTDLQYCDSYGAFIDTEDTTDKTTPIGATATEVNFALKEVPMNFYGRMKATITYGVDSEGEPLVTTATKYVTALGSKSTDANLILPDSGYPSDIDDYDDALVGYEVVKNTYARGKGHETEGNIDNILGGWMVAGSDGGQKAEIAEDEETGNKYISYSTTLSGSHALTHPIEKPGSQAIFEQDIRFSGDASITLTSGYATYQEKDYANYLTLVYDGGKLVLNGTELKKDTETSTVSKAVWYRLIVSIDPTTRTAYASLYDPKTKALLGTTGNVAWNGSEGVPNYYGISKPDKTAAATTDIDNYNAYYAVADTSTFTLTPSGTTTLSIPNGDTLDITASLLTANGLEMTGLAEWTVLEEDMAGGIVITPDESDSHKVSVSLQNDAAPGEATIQANIGGYIKTIGIELTSSAESVKFTTSETSVSIPLDDTPVVKNYAAIVVDGQGVEQSGREVTIELLNAAGTAPYTSDDESITFNNGVLTVTSAAKATTLTVRARSTNTDGQPISRSIKVNVHGLWFDFGAGNDDVAEGYTSITPSTAYTDKNGYGIVGTVTAGGTGSADNADSDYLDGAITFKAKVQEKKLYTVEITYIGQLTAEPVNSDLKAYYVGSSTTLTTQTYVVPVIDDMLELNVSTYTYTDTKGTDDKSDDVTTKYAPRVASIKITKNADKAAVTERPNIYHVGDSTAANNGSWAYSLAGSSAKYPQLFAIANFQNRGAGGRNLSTYYTEGKLASVLKDIRPGDIVMFGNNGTNGMGSSFEDDVKYYLDAAEALGAKIIINTYTPHGPVGNYTSGYDSSTHTFNTWRQDSYDNIVRQIAEERATNDPNYLGFVEIGKNADAAWNAYVAAADDPDAAAQEIISCFTDHNHYSAGSKARELMLDGYGEVKGIVAQLMGILPSYIATLGE